MWVCRLPVHIGPAEQAGCTGILSSVNPRGKEPGKPKRFSWLLQGGSGGEIEIPPGSFSFCHFFFWRSKKVTNFYLVIALTGTLYYAPQPWMSRESSAS